MYTATYSPEDNKLRLYSVTRLDKETYTRVKSAGFKWAPKQDLFVAPMWTPSREDLLIELAGEIGDEDTSLVDRQEQRAERFEDYSASRLKDANQAHAAVAAIADGIPFGQPILVGHHSEKHARKDAERIENGMRKAVKMWETSKYWQDRAAGALAHAKYKELPQVRARRIKGIEADKRKEERYRDAAEACIEFWSGKVTHAGALNFCNYKDHTSKCFTLAEYPREKPKSQYEGMMSLWSALGGSEPETAIITPEQAGEISLRVHRRVIASCARWIQHYENRLIYEKAMLEESGASDLLKPKPRPTLLPMCNYRMAEGITIENRWDRGRMMHYPLLEMTQAEYARICTDYKGSRIAGNSHRIRTCMRDHSLWYVFLTDAKVHTPPAPIETKPREEPVREPAVFSGYKTPEPTQFDAMRDSLKAGVQVVTAPQLFPTPADLAARMVELAEIQPGHDVLEPSAGTGRIVDALDAIPGAKVTAVEINHTLADGLRLRSNTKHTIRCADFLECNGDLGKFDRILMNPPFGNAADIKHIKHAIGMLRPGGKLVAICAGGPRQEEALQPLADTWEELPHGTFESSGTGVRTVLLTITAANPDPWTPATDGFRLEP